MKASSATSGKATGSPQPTVRSSARRRPSLTSAEGFALAGPSELPDPTAHAYRPDLADVALAGRVIASHYAEPLERTIAQPAELRAGPSDEAQAIAQLNRGDPFQMLDDCVGWVWGYGGTDRLVGYVRSEAVAAP